jgi:hypothetical protein
MGTDARTVQIPGVPITGQWGAPKRPLQDSVLIIYSVKSTEQHHRRIASLAVREYRRHDIRDDRPPDPDRFVCTQPEEFKIPASTGPRDTLNSELVNKLRNCVGAIAFVDDMRPNIAYELGFFHGMGRPVLLLSSSTPEPSWSNITDLAGSAVQQFTEEDLTALIHQYLDELFLRLENVDRWPSYPFPNPRHNLLSRSGLELRCNDMEIVKKGPFGRLVRLFEWQHPLNIRINKSLSDGARFKIAVRSPEDAHFSVYFELEFQDAAGKPRQVWLGLSSWLGRADYRNDERNMPTDPANAEWRFVTGTFADLQEQGHLGQIKNTNLKRVRFRAGEPNTTDRAAVEMGYLEIDGCL